MDKDVLVVRINDASATQITGDAPETTQPANPDNFAVKVNDAGAQTIEVS